MNMAKHEYAFLEVAARFVPYLAKWKGTLVLAMATKACLTRGSGYLRGHSHNGLRGMGRLVTHGPFA
jgi:hypothetical protein